jgi:hypothetical protein
MTSITSGTIASGLLVVKGSQRNLWKDRRSDRHGGGSSFYPPCRYQVPGEQSNHHEIDRDRDAGLLAEVSPALREHKANKDHFAKARYDQN